MTLKYSGKFVDLKEIIIECGLCGFGSFDERQQVCRFRADTGELVNWWVKTKTVNIQGTRNPDFERRFTKALARHRMANRRHGQTSIFH